MLGKKLDLDSRPSAIRKRDEPSSSLFEDTPNPTSDAAPAASASNPPLKRDITALMYGGAQPLFDAGALGGNDAESDEEDFLNNLKNPTPSQPEKPAAASGGAPPQQKKPKSNNPFGDTSSDDEDFQVTKGKGGGYQGKTNKFAAFMGGDDDEEEEKFVPKAKPQAAQPAP